jgi:hypothetical protein
VCCWWLVAGASTTPRSHSSIRHQPSMQVCLPVIKGLILAQLERVQKVQHMQVFHIKKCSICTNRYKGKLGCPDTSSVTHV